MNHSIYSADRTTHLKIVVVALLVGTAIAGFAITSRVGATTNSIAIIKAGQPVAMSSIVMLAR
jgi:hypothetical protein